MPPAPSEVAELYAEALAYAAERPVLPLYGTKEWRGLAGAALAQLHGDDLRNGTATLAAAWPTMWHGGVGGLKPGDWLEPPTVTGGRRSRGLARPDSVYIAADPGVAAGHAYLQGGTLYRVVTPAHIHHDELGSLMAWRGHRAQIEAVEAEELRWTSEGVAASEAATASGRYVPPLVLTLAKLLTGDHMLTMPIGRLLRSSEAELAGPRAPITTPDWALLEALREGTQ